MNELKLKTFIEQIEAAEEKSVPELEILLRDLTEKINTPGKNLDSHLNLLDLRDRVIVLLESLLPSRRLANLYKETLRSIANKNI